MWEATELEDGRLLAVGTDGKLWSMAADGSQRVPFSSSVEVGRYLPVGVPWPLGLSPDESQLAYLEKAETPGATEGWRVAVVRIADGSRVESWPVQLPAYHPPLFRWSHDGLAWQFLRSEGDVFNVWERQLAGGASKQLTRFTSGRIFTFEWSRDGRLVMTRGSVSRDVVLLELK